MKVVLDSNVVIAAFATQGLCHLLMESVLAYHKAILSPILLNEIEEKLRAKIRLPEVRIKEILVFLKRSCAVAQDKPIADIECRDPDDIQILALAINENVDVLVTGDKDLLVLRDIRGIPIESPREFWQRLRVSGAS